MNTKFTNDFLRLNLRQTKLIISLTEDPSNWWHLTTILLMPLDWQWPGWLRGRPPLEDWSVTATLRSQGRLAATLCLLVGVDSRPYHRVCFHCCLFDYCYICVRAFMWGTFTQVAPLVLDENPSWQLELNFFAFINCEFYFFLIYFLAFLFEYFHSKLTHTEKTLGLKYGTNCWSLERGRS